MIVSPINPVNFYTFKVSPKKTYNNFDSCKFENPYINKKPFIDRKIIKPGENINAFFDDISNKIFENPQRANEFSNMLKYGFISLSSSAYSDLKNPSSAQAVKIYENKDNISFLDKFIDNGIGVGINFSNFNDPVKEIKKINSHFKEKEKTTLRPPAGIALLDINHPKIIDFITLKDNESYNDWCFDLSVIIGDDFNNKEVYDTLLNSMLKKGEPGVIFSNNKDYICDSCASKELKENETLTLGQINLSRFYNYKTKKIDYNLLLRSANLINEAMKNIDKNSSIGILGYSDLLNKLNIKYGSGEALEILKNCLDIIKSQGANIAISPTGTISRVLNTTTGIDSKDANYIDELKTMALAQKYIDGQISKTIILDKNADKNDVDFILKYAKANGIKGISVFKK